jgi:hypothetical protein
MQHLPRGARSRAASWGPWMPALALLAVAAMVVASAPLSHAGDRAPGGGSGLVESGQGPDQVYGYTVHLPLVFRGHWVYPDSAFGVQIFGTNASLSTKLVNMGAKWVRLRLSWDDVEPDDVDPEDYLWSAAYERELARLAGQGVSIILTLMDNPDWAATNPGGPVDRADIGELVEFMQAAVERYSLPPYRVKYWEFYNEPDNGVPYFGELGEVGYFGYQPEAYVRLLQAVYQPLKAVDPEAQITFGGIAYDNFVDPWEGPFVRTFLDGVLEGGGGDYFDVMNFHYYPAFAWNWEAYGIDILGKYNYLRDKLASYGVYKPFICTETSTWSDAANGSSHELQSRYVAQVFVRSMAARLRFTIWFTFIDDPYLGTRKVGLLDSDYQPKPAYWAFQALARQLGGSAFVRAWTEAETGSPFVEAYEFGPGQGSSWPVGTARIVVAWTNDEEAHMLVVPGNALVQVDKYGGETVVYDGNDGQVDGLIHLILGPSPVYLHLPE